MFTLRELLDYAIQQEIDSQVLYRRGAEKVTDDKTRQFLRKLEKEEVEHEKMLFNIRETGMYDLGSIFTDRRLIELAGHSHGSNTFEFNESWTIDNILNIALKREFAAKTVYEVAAESAQDQELKTLFSNLAETEAIHHRDVEKYYKMHTGVMGEEF